MSDELNPGRAAFPPFIPESPTRFAQPADPTPTRLQRFLNWLNIRDLPRTVVQDWNQDDGVYHMRPESDFDPYTSLWKMFSARSEKSRCGYGKNLTGALSIFTSVGCV
jgi:hypothetical protein